MFFKESRRIITQELEKVEREKNALDNLSKSGRISPEVYKLFSEDLTETLTLIEERLKKLDTEVSRRKGDLEQQILILEKLFAGLEAEHLVGAIKGERYKDNYETLMLGLEASKKEIECISGAPTPSPQEAEPIEEETVKEQAPREETVETGGEEVIQLQEDELQESAGLLSLETVEDDYAILETDIVKDRRLDEWNGGNNSSEVRCLNPWNKDCHNTDIGIYIYYNNKRIPICHVCWEKLADKDLDL